MKPIYLEVSAFGAFGGVEKIDFTKIRGGLFLICGETGAGKTTVFDAVSYALYGEMSGSIRSAKGARSDFSDGNVATYVLLRFLYREKMYEITRSPSHERKKLRGEGFTSEKSRVCLKLPDSTVLSSEPAVKSKITELLGLTHSQWKQVAMIAQGEFAKCLYADSDERSAIFRNIFQTHIYGLLAAKLKEEELAAKRSFERSLFSLRQYINGTVISEQSRLYADFRASLENVTIDGLTASRRILAELTSGDLKRHSELSEDCETLRKWLNEKSSAIENAAIINRHIHELENERLLRKQLLESRTRIDSEEEFILKAETLSSEIIALAGELKKHTKADMAKAEMERLLKALSQMASGLEKTAEEKKSVVASKIEIESTLQEHKDSKLHLNRRLNDLAKAEERLSELNTLLKDMESYTALRESYKSIRYEFEQRQRELKNAEDSYTCKYKVFISEQAGVLAAELTEGTPCPVCGSKSHPRKAVRIGEIPSEAELKTLEKAVSKARTAAHTAETSLGAKEAEGIEARKSIVRSARRIIENFPADMQMAKIGDVVEAEILRCELKTASLKQEADAYRKDVNLLEAAEKAQKETEAELERLNDVEKRQSEEIFRVKSLIALKEGEYAEIRSELTHADRTETARRLSEIAKELALNNDGDLAEILAKRMNSSRRTISDYNNSLIKLDAKIETLLKLVGDRNPIDTAEMEHEALIIKRDYALLESEKADVWAAYKSNSELLEKIDSGMDMLKNEERKYGVAERLSKTANGELKGRQKLALEMYVQRAYFHKILKTANIRLKIMTNGRFELMRKQTSANLKNKSFALDLDVIDNTTGKTRDISSLSGGESFMAALALALAVSDTIQREAGGVEIDTMFIDEGFGSLSPEYLSLVVKTLTSLSEGDGKKLIGIISHVEALKDNIDEQIQIVKTPRGGSRIIAK